MKLIVGLAALFGLGGAFDAKSLPAPEPARAGADASAQAELKALVRRTAPEAMIEADRYFTVGDEVRWVSVVKRLDNLARGARATRVRFAASDPGKTLVEGWRGRDKRGVVAAMLLRQGGGGTIAYYQVRFGAAG